jgi:hypothetical protein
MSALTLRQSRRSFWRSLFRRQRIALALLGLLVSALLALVSHLKSVEGEAIPGLDVDGHIAVSSVQRWQSLGAYHEALARKYEFATSNSWLPVSADPPPPQ